MDPQAFWSSNYYEHPHLTDEMVRSTEERYDVKLPAAYVNLLRIQNGGYTQGFGHPMPRPTTWSEDHVPLDSLAGIDPRPDSSSCHNILDTEYMINEWDLPERQILLTGDGHWWITLDYRKGPDPVVTWLNVDSEQDFEIAPSFEQFLNGLRPKSTFDSE